jgi:hypothetical protein
VKLGVRGAPVGWLYVIPRPEVTNIHSRKFSGRISSPPLVKRGVASSPGRLATP